MVCMIAQYLVSFWSLLAVFVCLFVCHVVKSPSPPRPSSRYMYREVRPSVGSLTNYVAHVGFAVGQPRCEVWRCRPTVTYSTEMAHIWKILVHIWVQRTNKWLWGTQQSAVWLIQLYNFPRPMEIINCCRFITGAKNNEQFYGGFAIYCTAVISEI